MRIAIVGSRGISKEILENFAYEKICENIPLNATEIVSGGAVGIDTLAEKYAKSNGIKTKIFLPDYDKHGKRAPLYRNDEIVAYSQYVIALWDGKSRGTAYTVAKCIEKGVPVKIISIPTENEEDENEY
ncbi:MAG: DNA-processing protein DprA [Eubacteriales bacterium]